MPNLRQLSAHTQHKQGQKFEMKSWPNLDNPISSDLSGCYRHMGESLARLVKVPLLHNWFWLDNATTPRKIDRDLPLRASALTSQPVASGWSLSDRSVDFSGSVLGVRGVNWTDREKPSCTQAKRKRHSSGATYARSLHNNRMTDAPFPLVGLTIFTADFFRHELFANACCVHGWGILRKVIHTCRSCLPFSWIRLTLLLVNVSMEVAENH